VHGDAAFGLSVPGLVYGVEREPAPKTHEIVEVSPPPCRRRRRRCRRRRRRRRE